MGFGQAAGPPASGTQLARLGELLSAAGFESFREARHPLGLTQRQSNGKFTRDEADELIGRLEAEAEDVEPAPPPARPPARAVRPSPSARASQARPAPAQQGAAVGDVVTAFPDELLAAELVRRGWTCNPPPGGG